MVKLKKLTLVLRMEKMIKLIMFINNLVNLLEKY